MEICLHEFVSFLKTNGSSHVTNKLAVEYATQRQYEKPVSWSRRLGIIRGFARYRIGADPRTEIPPLGLLRFRSQRAKPYLYSEDEICRLLEAARGMKTQYQLQPHTYYCLFGLLAVTGLRLGEAIASNRKTWICQRESSRSVGPSLGSRGLFPYTRPRGRCC